VNAIVDDDERRSYLKHSMDPQKSARQEVTERRTGAHVEKSLLKSASEIWDALPQEKKASLGINEYQIRQFKQGGNKRQFPQKSNRGGFKRGRYNGNRGGGNGGGRHGQQHRQNHQGGGGSGNYDGNRGNQDGNRHNSNYRGGYKGKNWKDSRDHRPIPALKKEEKKEYIN
jgi:hypothetical protein